MTATPVAFSTKDSANGQLQSGINNSVTSIPLESGDGAAFPQPYNGTATSSGSSTTLNSTGILAAVGGSSSAMAGKYIWNKTDGSVAVIVSVATNALSCTRLLGGTDNTWDSSDVWCIDPFVATFAAISTSAYGVVSITTSEQALIIGRSTDTLTVATGGRGYNSTSANSFSAGDQVYLFSTSPIVERFKDVIAVMGVQQDTDRTTLATAGTNITNLQTGAYHYVVATGSSSAYVAATPALAALAAGNIVRFKANHTNTGATTLNVNGLGATAIKKLDGATALAANDIISGQIVTVVYDGTNFQMVSPIGQLAASDVDVLNSNTSDSSAAGTSTSSEANFSQNYVIPTTAWAAGTTFRVNALVRIVANNSDTAILRMKLGTTTLASKTYTNGVAGVRSVSIMVTYYLTCLSTGAGGTATHWGHFIMSTANSSTDFISASEVEEVAGFDLNGGGTDTDPSTDTISVDTTTTNTLQLSIDYGGSSANNAARLQRLIVEKLAVN